MIDLKWVREFPDAFDAKLKLRDLAPLSAKILALDEKNRALLTELQILQQERNDVAKKMGMAKENGEDATDLIKRGSDIKEKIPAVEAQADAVKSELTHILMSTPNNIDDATPVGKDESENVEIYKVGEVPSFDFEPKQHFELGETLGLMDFEKAAQLSGSRFVVLKGAMARLERALAQFMINLHTMEFGYEEISAPVLVRDQALYGTGQLPKFAEDQFKTDDGYWLIPTSEVTLTNMAAKMTVDEEKLPMRMTSATLCFRSEAGSAGRDTRGMLRQHQFAKVELVSIVHPEESEAEHERMTNAAEEVLKRLEIPYRKVLLCTGDIGFAAKKTYDLEAWMPGQDAYREISSCSNCGDFQARRMNARFKPFAPGEKVKPEFVHTLNGSGIAVGRALIAVLENYQQADGSIKIPTVLQPYMGGQTVID